MTETRFKQNVLRGYEWEQTQEILSILDEIRVKKKCNVQAFLEDAQLARGIHSSLLKKDLIAFILPAFPFKSENVERKCLGSLPDKAEKLAMENLESLGAKLSAIARTRLLLALDGFAYADIVGVPESKVITYSSEIAAMRPTTSPIEFFGIENSVENGRNLPTMLDEHYSPSLETVREKIETDSLAREQYAGLVMFWSVDLDRSDNPAGSKERARQAKKMALAMMARNAGYSTYLAEKFPDAIRLSIHASHGRTGRYHINVIPGTQDTSGGSPWHGVAVKTGDAWRIVRREQAERAGYLLVYERGRPSHYVESETTLRDDA